MNHSDSERIAGFLEAHKLKPAKNINEAALTIFNTCGVRQSAEDRVYGQIHNIRKNYPKMRIILTGCLADRKDVQKRLKNKVDLFFPINNFKIFGNWIIKNCLEIENCKLIIPVQKNSAGKIKCTSYLSIIPKYSNTFQAFVPIMTGCNNFCSYCVVPYARGQEISRPAEEILSELKTLVKNGCREIVLLGQNVNSYKDDEINFSTLLKKANNIPGNFWIYFVSNHPKDFSDELIETATKLKKVCECIHLPVQAGSDEIIQKMNRKYTAKQYLKLINKVKKAFQKNKPGELFAITSDIIVGFPGESRKQFLKSANIMEEVSYDMVYFGQFSSRPKTAAWKMKDNVSKKEKERREKYLNVILKKTALKNNKNYLGKVIDILITSKKGNYYFGHTRTFKKVKLFSEKKGLIGKIVKSSITKINPWNLEGKTES